MLFCFLKQNMFNEHTPSGNIIRTKWDYLLPVNPGDLILALAPMTVLPAPPQSLLLLLSEYFPTFHCLAPHFNYVWPLRGRFSLVERKSRAKFAHVAAPRNFYALDLWLWFQNGRYCWCSFCCCCTSRIASNLASNKHFQSTFMRCVVKRNRP